MNITRFVSVFCRFQNSAITNHGDLTTKSSKDLPINKYFGQSTKYKNIVCAKGNSSGDLQMNKVNYSLASVWQSTRSHKYFLQHVYIACPACSERRAHFTRLMQHKVNVV